MPSRPGSPGLPVDEEYEEMTIDEIVNGSPAGDFPGLIPIVESYLDSVNVDVETRCQLATYLSLISKRASGELDTAARWIRNFVDAHPRYKHDSVVDEAMTHDLIGAVIAVGEREAAGRERLHGAVPPDDLSTAPTAAALRPGPASPRFSAAASPHVRDLLPNAARDAVVAAL